MSLKEFAPEGRIDPDNDCSAFTLSATALRRTPIGKWPITWACLSRESGRLPTARREGR